jgi:SAM-dependent methyltransferase
MANWFDPHQLSASERKIAGRELEEIANEGDFGAYAEVNRTDNFGETLPSHNLIKVAGRVEVYRQILKRDLAAIADIGCGIGLTACELSKQFAPAKVHGYEVSQEAVAYAKRACPDVNFVAGAISPDSDLDIGFDLILAQEFYPFTRTGDFSVQSDYLEFLAQHLLPGGVALIVLSERDRHQTLLANLPELRDWCEERDLVATYFKLPFDRIYRTLPVLWMSRLASIPFSLFGYDRLYAVRIEAPWSPGL